jgi:hypothetical protein
MVSPLIGQGVALATRLLPNNRTWFIANLDSGEVLQGQFEPVGATKEVPTTWGQQTALNRSNPILQFLHGNAKTISFQVRLFQETIPIDIPLIGTAATAEAKLSILEKWTEIDPSVRRPPIVQFWVGDGHLRMNAVISSLSGITFGSPDFFGGLRDVSLTVNLLQFTPFSLEDEGVTDTRFARAKTRDYYELLAFQEYGNPLLGDVIRKDHPDQQHLALADVVRLPSIEGVRGQQVTQKSIALRTAYGRKDTAQRRLRQRFFDLRSGSRVSFVFQPSTTPT